MLNIKQIFTWWHKQTLGTSLKTLFFGKFVGSDETGNKYYENKKTNDRWVVYFNNIEATKITSKWYLWMHHTTNDLPKKEEKQHLWQKEHLENLTGTDQNKRKNRIEKNEKFKKYETWKK